MVLTAHEESLMSVIRSLPPEEEVLNWACQLADLAGGRPVEWSDAWSE